MANIPFWATRVSESDNEFAKIFLDSKKLDLTKQQLDYLSEGKYTCATAHIAYEVSKKFKLKIWKADHQPRHPPEMMRIFTWTSFYQFEFNSFLDLGCGAGFPTGLALTLGYNAYGVDLNSRMVRRARKNCKNAGFEKNRIMQADYLSEEFWETEIGGILPANFDLLHLYNWEDKISSTLRSLLSKANSKTRVAVAGDWYNNATFRNSGWEIETYIPDNTILRKLREKC